MEKANAAIALAPRTRTLEDVRKALPTIYSASSALVYATALDKAARLTGRKLSQLPADVVAWEDIAAKLVWAGNFPAAAPEKSERAFRAWVKRISAAIRRLRAPERLPPLDPRTSTGTGMR